MEMTDWRLLYEEPLHPYTKALLAAVPIPDPEVEARRERVILRGEVPSPLNPPSGCVFHPRCPLAIEACAQAVPELREINSGHWAACIRV
jgi:oligopeptide transport system ATP-binding protein